MKFIRKNSLILVSFFIALSLFLYQHATGLSWDFSVYVLNARYLLGQGNYFEWLRPPLTSYLIALFGAGLLAEYAFITLVAFFHLISSYKLAKKVKINPSLFYLLSLTPYMILFSFSAGSELLSLSLTQLMISYASGVPLGFSILTRYSNLVYSLLLFFKGRFKLILKELLIAALIVSPWLFINFSLKHDPLFSMIDQYANNIGLRDYAWKPFDINDLLITLNYTMPFLALGLLFTLRKPGKISKYDIIMIFIIVYELINYYRVPLKESRYLFNLIIPVSYFSSKAFHKLRLEKVSPLFILVLNIGLIPSYLSLLSLTSPNQYLAVKELNISCMTESNDWVFLNYLGVNSEPFPRKELLGLSVSQGYQVIFFKFNPEPDYVFNNSLLSQFPIFYNESRFIILWDSRKCVKPYTYDLSYLEGLNKSLNDAYGYGISYTIWDILK